MLSYICRTYTHIKNIQYIHTNCAQFLHTSFNVNEKQRCQVLKTIQFYNIGAMYGIHSKSYQSSKRFSVIIYMTVNMITAFTLTCISLIHLHTMSMLVCVLEWTYCELTAVHTNTHALSENVTFVRICCKRVWCLVCICTLCCYMA